MSVEFPATADPYPTRTTCAFPGCPVSVEEHHRVNIGLVKENGVLRARLRSQGMDAGRESSDLTLVSTNDLLKELARRP